MKMCERSDELFYIAIVSKTYHKISNDSTQDREYRNNSDDDFLGKAVW